MSENEKIVLTVFNHTKWGAILLPVLVEARGLGELCILETAQKSFSELADLNDAAREIIRITERYADRILMKSYSKEKTIREFHATVTKKTIDSFIRPFIERCHQKIIGLLPESGFALYLRGDTKTRSLWPADQIHVPDQLSTVVFSFVKDENGFRYFLRIKNESGLTDLYNRNYLIVCREPAVVVTNKELLHFEDIDVKKLMPFFNKKVVEIPRVSEKTYLKTFVRNCLQKFTVNIAGIDVKEIQPRKEALLFLENDWNHQLILLLNLSYEGKKYPLDHQHRKIVLTDETSEKVSLRWFLTDKAWEKGTIDFLTGNGLVQNGPNTFILPECNPVSVEEKTVTLVDWLRVHIEAVMATFSFMQNLDNRKYYLGEIAVEMIVNSKQDWFELRSMVVFESFKIPFAHFRQHILKNIREYVLPDGTIAVLPQEWFTNYYEAMFFCKEHHDVLLLKKSQYRIIEAIDSHALFPTSSSGNPPQVPETLRAQLRNYQITGFQWLVWLYREGFGGCLADDMGLGKTLQTIALLVYIEQTFREKSPRLPCNETAINPRQNIRNLPFNHSQNQPCQLSLFDFIENEPDTGNESTDQGSLVANKNLPSLVVMPTSLLYNWQNEFRKFAPTLSIYIYSGSKRLKSNDIGAVLGHYQVVLTTYGVLRNDIEWLETCSFHHLILDESQYVKNPHSQIYQAIRKIRALYRIALTGTPIENSLNDLWAQFNLLNENMLGSHASFKSIYLNPIAKENKERETALLRLIQPFLLRRTKKEAAPDLPPLLEEIVYCDMSPAQEACYVNEKNLLRTRLLSEKVLDNPSQLSLLTLQGLTRLRLMANHPVLVHPNYTEDSGKFDQVLMRLETLRSEGHKVLVFSSFVRHLKLLADVFKQENIPYAWLSGSSSSKDREAEIHRFTKNTSVSCFLISLKAGGVGLNLTAADYVFLLDPWWNPASEIQALSRSHRIGQDKTVIVYRFLSSNTIEEKIRRLQESKSKLADTFVQSNNPLSALNHEELSLLMD